MILLQSGHIRMFKPLIFYTPYATSQNAMFSSSKKKKERTFLLHGRKVIVFRSQTGSGHVEFRLR